MVARRGNASVDGSPTFDTDDEAATIGQAGAHQRSEPRDSMLLSATIRLNAEGEIWPIRVRNISAGGLMADCSGPLKRGDEVELELRGVGLQKATVVWTAQDRIGIAFERPINPILARKPVRQGRTPAAPTAADVKRPWLRTI
jgi:hypothetical protein